MNHHNFNLSPLSLTTNNSFEIIANGTGNTDRNSVSRIEVKYPRQFNFDNESSFGFSLTGTSVKRINISNFDDKGTQPVLFDITNRKRIVGTAGGPHHFHLNYTTSSTESELFLSSQHSDDITTIGSLESVNFTDWSNPVNQGDYIIISNPDLFDDGAGIDNVEKYRQYRSSFDGGSYTAITVDVTELYDQFAYGNLRHPLAIRHFIHYAVDNWSIQPEYLFLIGKGRTWVSNYASQTATNQTMVPTFGYPGSDVLLTAKKDEYEPLVPSW